jgi:hypothetical protein
MSFVGKFNYLESIFPPLIGFYITCFLNLVTCLIRSEKLKLYLSELGELDYFVWGGLLVSYFCVLVQECSVLFPY